MLEERGKIIVALEKKLEEQVQTEMMTLEAIEFEKGRFIADSHRKFKDYERKIEELINEIYLLNE
jgi:phage host-nuclease inhibitor protein Gam